MEAGTYDVDEDIADLHSSVRRLKHVSKAIQEETSLTRQILDGLVRCTLKSKVVELLLFKRVPRRLAR